MKRVIPFSFIFYIFFSQFQAEAQDTWYVFQDGNWNDPNTWTTDASTAPLFNNPGSETPTSDDDVIIRSGRTVTIQVGTDNLELNSIKVDGNLYLTNSTGHDFTTINGSGIIRFAGYNPGGGLEENFPAGDISGNIGFGDPDNGGTAIVYAAGDITLNTARDFRHMRIELTDNSYNAILGNDINLNGDLEVRNGNLQVGDGTTTARTLTVIGDVLVSDNGSTRIGSISTANANARHEFNLYGDFTNNGDVQFSQRTTQSVNSEATDGIVDLNLVSTYQDQVISCLGPTYFYRVEIDKASTDYTADFQASDESHFVLTGPANDDYDLEDASPTNSNAFTLLSGTASIGNNVTIDPLNNTGIYSIPNDARLLIDGGIVNKSAGSAIVPYGTLEIAAGELNATNPQGLVLREDGLIKVSGGTVQTATIRTSFVGASSVGGYVQTGGEVTIDGEIASFNDDYAALSLTYSGNVFIMSGGDLTVKGAQDLDGNEGGLIFINSDPANQSVTGGTVIVESSNTNNGNRITTRAPFYNLTITNSAGSTNGNARVNVAAGGSFGETISSSDLVVLNDLTIETGTTRDDGTNEYGGYLDLCPDGTNCVNLEVGRNLTIEDSGVLDLFTDDAEDAGSATLSFNGNQNGIFYIGDITTYTNALTDYNDPDGDESYVDYRLPLYDLVIDKSGGTLQLQAKNPGVEDGAGVLTSTNGKNLDSNNARLLYISNGLTISSGSTLNQIDPTGDQYGYIIRAYADTINIDGNLLLYEQGVNPVNSFLELREQGDSETTVGDVILINSTDESTIGNVVLDLGNDELKLGNNLAVTRMAYRHGGVNLGTYNLQVDILDFNTEEDEANNRRLRQSANGEYLFGDNQADAEQYFFTEGNASDGGLSVKVPRITNIHGSDDEQNVGFDPSYDNENNEYQNNNLLWFPIGIKDKYTPAVVYLHDNGTTSGDEYITVRPVNDTLKTTDLSGGDILSYYWNVGFEGYASGEEPTVSWLFQYDDADVGSGDETMYVPGKVLNGGDYTRSDDGDEDAVKDDEDSGSRGEGNANEDGNIMGRDPGNIIIFNGITLESDTNDDIDSGTDDNIFHVNDESTDLTVNPVDNNWDDAFPGTGFTLENANYTAGEAARFTGSPGVYYTALSSNFTASADLWSDPTTWSTEGHQSDVNSLGSYPQAGDVAYIGFDNMGGSGNDATHRIIADIDIEIAALNFSRYIDTDDNGKGYTEDDGSLPNLETTSDGLAFGAGGVLGLPPDITAELGIVDGFGRLQIAIGCDPCSTDPSASTVEIAGLTGDFGLFAENTDSQFYFDLGENLGDDGFGNDYNPNPVGGNNAVFLPTSFPEVYPRFTVRGDGTNDGGLLVVQEDITVNGRLTLRDAGGVLLNSGANGDMLIKGDLDFSKKNNEPERFIFPDAGSRTITIEGNIDFGGDDTGIDSIAVRNDVAAGAVHRLIVEGDITLGDDEDIFDLFSPVGGTQVILELKGESNTSFSVNDNPTRELYQIVMNKGSDQTYTFTFNDEFTISDPDDTDLQPIEILNGVLVFNNAAIDVQLTNEDAGDFYLPNTENSKASSGSGGLEILQGTARIEGDDTGIILDGLLRISGGTLDMDDGTNNGNNFIEYSSSGEARLEVTSGNLTVGSQIRRGLNSNTGVLQYVQNGGTVVIGKNTAPESTRGLFEITNNGSYFEHTSGSLMLVRDNNSTSIPSLLLEPASTNIADGTAISLGNGDTPATQDRFGIQSSAELAEIEIASDKISAKIYNLPLTANILDIVTDADFDANGFDLSITENLNNDGTFVTSGNSTNNQTTDFTISSGNTATITGSGTTTFWNFEKSGSGTLALSKNVTVTNNAYIYEGTFNTQTSAFNLEKDLLHDAIHTSDAAGPGIIFNGTQEQILDRSGSGTSELGVVNLDNASGLLIRDTEENFVINEKLTLTTGVFDVGGNLIEFPEDAFIENGSGNRGVGDFNVNIMIQTNSAIRDFGIRKHFDAVSGGSETFTFPVGLVAYTPVVVNINDISASSITIRPVRDIPPIAEDTEDTDNAGTGTCTDPDITDADNVLQYYWIVKSSGVSGFVGDIQMYYDSDDIEVTAPYTIANYGPARIYNSSDNWDKVFTTSDFDESNQEINFPFTGNGDATLEGIYTAGVTLENDGTTLLCGAAIPDQVPQFVTNDAGGGDFFTDATYTGGTAPDVGETPDITVQAGDILTFDQSNIRTRKITVESGGTLVIQNGTNNHNLGFVTGEGTIRLESNSSSISFPTGDFEEFFPDASCSGGGGLEYAGSGTYPVLSDLPNIRRVIFSGSGTRTFPNNFALNVCEDIDIRGTVSVIIPDGNNNTTVQGNIYKSDGSDFDSGIGNSRVIMEGSSAQSIQGDFTGLDAFNELEIDNAAGVTIVNSADATRGISANQAVEIDKTLVLTNGRLTTDDNNTLTINTSGTASPATGSASSFVNGKLHKVISNGSSFTFPIGKGSRWGYASVNNTTGGGDRTWYAEYFNGSVTSEPGVNLTPADPAEIETISSNEYWKISDNPSGASATIGLSWNGQSDVSNDAGDLDELRVMAWNTTNSNWDNLGGTSHSGGIGNGSLEAISTLSFSERIVTLGSTTTANPLPVEFISFNAEYVNEKVLLTWTTASELNNDYFEVQRSTDGVSFEKIGKVKGVGNSNTLVDYEFADRKPLSGLAYYRLRQVDFDGQFDFSNIVSVIVPVTERDFQAYFIPNPTTGDNINLQVVTQNLESKIHIILADLQGNVLVDLAKDPHEVSQGIQLETNGNLSAGVYIAHIQQAGVSVRKRIILR